MPQSMTGHGVGRAIGQAWVAQVELRSVNHRHLDLRFRLNSTSAALQARLSEVVRRSLGRGHITVQLEISRAEGVPTGVMVDRELAQGWGQALREVARAAGLKGEPTPAEIAAMEGVLRVERLEDSQDDLYALVLPALEEALSGLLKSRREEGERLAVDLRERLVLLDTLRLEVEELANSAVDNYRVRLRERVSEMLRDRQVELDEARLEHELVIFADRMDITEELVRLRGHLLAFSEALAEEEPGRKLGFLSQELLREVNTIGSKTHDLAITQRVVQAKVEIERLREQVQNLA